MWRAFGWLPLVVLPPCNWTDHVSTISVAREKRKGERREGEERRERGGAEKTEEKKNG